MKAELEKIREHMRLKEKDLVEMKGEVDEADSKILKVEAKPRLKALERHTPSRPECKACAWGARVRPRVQLGSTGIGVEYRAGLRAQLRGGAWGVGRKKISSQAKTQRRFKGRGGERRVQ